MKKNPLKDGILTKDTAGIGAVTQAMLRERAIELAVQDGRTATEVSKPDWEQARKELLGAANAETNQEILESAPESERWDPVPGTSGHKVPPAPSEDEDEDGRSDNQKLVEEGVAAAEDDHERQASRDASSKET